MSKTSLERVRLQDEFEQIQSENRDFDISKHPVAMQNDVLNAFYFPDGNYQDLNDSITLVNTYRIVMNHFFHQQLPILENESFIAK